MTISMNTELRIVNCTQKTINVNGEKIRNNQHVGIEEYGTVYITNQYRWIERRDVFLLDEILAMGEG